MARKVSIASWFAPPCSAPRSVAIAATMPSPTVECALIATRAAKVEAFRLCSASSTM